MLTNMYNKLIIDFGTYCIKLSDHNTPILDEYGMNTIQNMISAQYNPKEYIGNTLLYSFPQNNNNNIAYGIIKHLEDKNMCITKKTSIKEFLERFLKYLLSFHNTATIYLIQSPNWTLEGFNLIHEICFKYNIITIPYHVIVYNKLSSIHEPFVVIDFGESLNCLYIKSKDEHQHERMLMGGNLLTKYMRNIIFKQMKEKKKNILLSDKYKHKLWVFAEKVKRILSVNTTYNDIFETSEQDFNISVNRKDFEQCIHKFTLKYYNFVLKFLQTIIQLHTLAHCNIYVHGGCHRLPCITCSTEHIVDYLKKYKQFIIKKNIQSEHSLIL